METATFNGQDTVEMPEVEADDTPAPAGGSTLDRLRSLYHDKALEHHLDIPVAGLDGEVVARYHPVDRDAMRRIVAKQEKSKNPNGDFYAEADVLIASLEGIYCVTDQGLQPAVEGEVTKWDGWCDLLDLEYDTARQALLQAFSRAPSPELAIQNVSARLYQWMASVDEETAEDIAGE